MTDPTLPRLPLALPAATLDQVRDALTQAAAVIDATPGRLRDRPDYVLSLPGNVACRLQEAHHALNRAKTVEVDVVEVASLRNSLENAEARLDAMDQLRVEYTPEDWVGETGYGNTGMDLPPHLYSWQKLDEMMGHVGEEADRLMTAVTQGHVTPEYVGTEMRRTMSLYRHMVRTLCARDQAGRS